MARTAKDLTQFTFNLRNMARGPGYTMERYLNRAMRGLSYTMMNWLVGDTQVFGLVIQNWMLFIGGGLALYFAALAIIGRRRQGMR
jgi:hypothetical protein